MLAPPFNVYYSYWQSVSRVYVCHVQLKNCMGSKFRKYWLTLLNICYCVAMTMTMTMTTLLLNINTGYK